MTVALPDWLEERLACPACGGPVAPAPGGRCCGSCGRSFPDRFGIPDFRLEPDPYISFEDEEAKVRRVLEGAEGAGWRELVERYYTITPENPPSLHRRYVRSMEAAFARAEGLLDRLERRFPDAPRTALLDLGCGTCGLTIAAAGRWPRTVGVDVALRWIAIGHRRQEEEGIEAPLLLANAEALPLHEGAVGAVVADAVLEHARRSRDLLDETLRVLAPGGGYLLTTNNRWSALPEPHVRIWGFGLLPRRWMEPAARRLRRTPYRARLHSPLELARVVAGRGRVTLPELAPGSLGPGRERARRAWEALRRFPPTRAVLRLVAPLFYIEGEKPRSQS